MYKITLSYISFLTGEVAQARFLAFAIVLCSFSQHDAFRVYGHKAYTWLECTADIKTQQIILNLENLFLNKNSRMIWQK